MTHGYDDNQATRPNDEPKPPTDEIERCINIAQDEGYSGINARTELATLRADAELMRCLRTTWVFDDQILADAKKWRTHTRTLG